MSETTLLVRLCRIAGWLALLAIVIVSVVPNTLRPHVLEDKHVEHFSAYLAAGMLWAMGWRRDRQLLLAGGALAACSATLEIIQLWVPGRTSSVADFLASSLGAWAGLAMIYLLRNLQARSTA